MIALTDPLWKKLDSAHRDWDIPALLSELSETWHDEQANALFWDCLCHQETCYGATYAAVPHLLNVARPAINRHQRRQISLFLGAVVLCAFDRRSGFFGQFELEPLQGLSTTVEAWNKDLDMYRNLVARLEDPERQNSEYEQVELLPRYQKILAEKAIDERDIEKILAIRAVFIQTLPEIRALCERAYRENLKDPEVLPYLLSGLAAADGLFDLAYLLHCGSAGSCA